MLHFLLFFYTNHCFLHTNRRPPPLCSSPERCPFDTCSTTPHNCEPHNCKPQPSTQGAGPDQLHKNKGEKKKKQTKKADKTTSATAKRGRAARPAALQGQPPPPAVTHQHRARGRTGAPHRRREGGPPPHAATRRHTAPRRPQPAPPPLTARVRPERHRAVRLHQVRPFEAVLVLEAAVRPRRARRALRRHRRPPEGQQQPGHQSCRQPASLRACRHLAPCCGTARAANRALRDWPSEGAGPRARHVGLQAELPAGVGGASGRPRLRFRLLLRLTRRGAGDDLFCSSSVGIGGVRAVRASWGRCIPH